MNILLVALSTFLMFFSGLSEISSLAVPRKSRALDLALKMSTTSVPTRYSDSVVVEVPIPMPPPQPRYP